MKNSSIFCGAHEGKNPEYAKAAKSIADLIAKKGTPTMGGLLIILSVLVSTFLWADLTNSFIWIAIITILIFGLIGFADDYKKLKTIQVKVYHLKLEFLFK